MANSPSRRSTRFSMRSKQLGQILLETNAVKVDHIAKALKTQEANGGLVGQILREMGCCDDKTIAAALLKQVQVTDIHCEELRAQEVAISAVTQAQCMEDKLCPFERLGNMLCVIMGNPLNRRAINAIEEETSLKVKTFKAPWPKIRDLIERAYGGDTTDAPIEGGSSASTPTLELPPDPLGETESEPTRELPPIQFQEEEEVEDFEEPEAPEPTIEGIDTLDEENAEVIESDQRGLTRRLKPIKPDDAPKPKPKKVAKVNIDLDALDLDEATEVVGTEEELDDSLEEISADSLKVKTQKISSRSSKAERPQISMETFDIVQKEYFYSDEGAPENNSDCSGEYLELIDQIPVALEIAAAFSDYKNQNHTDALAVEFQASPEQIMPAVLLTENEFERMTQAMVKDPVGEWAWKFSEAGPVAVNSYE